MFNLYSGRSCKYLNRVLYNVSCYRTFTLGLRCGKCHRLKKIVMKKNNLKKNILVCLLSD